MQKKMKKDERYHYAECGLDYIYLLNGFQWVETPRGKGIHITDVEGLHRAIGEMLANERKTLSGSEFRYLRHELNMTQQVLADLLRVDVQSVARWEKDKIESIPGPAQGLIRLLYLEKIADNRAICEPLERLAELDEMMGEADEIDFTQDNSDGWQQAA